MPDTAEMLPVIVVGADLTGMPIDRQFTTPGGRLLTTCCTARAGDWCTFIKKAHP